MDAKSDLSQLSAEQLRTMVAQLMAQNTQQAQVISQQVSTLEARNQTIAEQTKVIADRDEAIARYRIREDKLSMEIALLRRHRFGKRSEGLDVHQYGMLEDLVDEDTSAIEAEMEKISVKPEKKSKQQPKRQALPAHLPRTEIRHDPENTQCACGCQMQRIGEDVSERLNYTPGTFSVDRHIRGKWSCKTCETLIQEPVAPHVIDKGIATSELLAHVLVSKYADHQPLYRQQQIFNRAGVEIPRSTLADWVGRCGVELRPLIELLRDELLKQPVLHADETPVAMLAPGKKKTHTAYVWAYASTRYSDIRAVVYDFRPTRSGKEARNFLQSWKGKLVCDDYAGYKAGFAEGITECGCCAHARRKFYDLYLSSKSPVAEAALKYISTLYDIEREAADMTPEQRYALRQEKSKPLLALYRDWLIAQRAKITNGTATAKAVDYTLKRWDALTIYLSDGNIPIDNNWVENQIRPWALGRSNWLFAGSLRSGERAANIMSLIQSAKINGLDPQAYLKDVLDRIPIIKFSQLHELLPHNWKPDDKVE